MTTRAAAAAARCRANFRAAAGVLLVLREPPPAPPFNPNQPPLVAADPAEGAEPLLALWDDGSVTALHGHVDLGTGLRTALTQLVAEELDLSPDRVQLVMGDTASAPNQGATIASASIQVHSAPLRAAAAQAVRWLRARGGRLPLADEHVELLLDLETPLKPAAEHQVVGRAVPRVDIPAKLRGGLAGHDDAVFVHDQRVPGMLHGRVVRPPYAGADHGDFIGNTLQAVDESSIAHIPGVRAVVVVRDFIGVVAEREEHADQAARELRVRWKPWPGLPDVADLEHALRSHPSTPRRLVDEGDVDAGMAAAAQRMPRTYVWPYQLHASIGPSCAVADWRPAADVDTPASASTAAAADGSRPGGTDSPGGGTLTVWAGTQNPHVLRADLARLLGIADSAVIVERLEAAGCYGRNGADDVAADAALLSRAVGAPVRVQLTREQENAWEPKGAAQLMTVDGGLRTDGSVAAYDFSTAYPSNGAPTLALLLTRTIEPVAQAFQMGDRTARPPYAFDNLRVTVNDMAPLLRAAWLRGVSALPNTFAHESYIDELAIAAGVDPVAFRLRYLHDERAAELVRATAARAGWVAHTAPRGGVAETDTSAGAVGAAHAIHPSGPANALEAAAPAAAARAAAADAAGPPLLRGQGFAYARYVHSAWPGFGAAWAAWVADVEVDPRSGEVWVRRVVVGHDAGLLVNPAGVDHQVHGNVIQTTSRALLERAGGAVAGNPPATRLALPGQATDGKAVAPPLANIAGLEWGAYPILRFSQVPVIDVLHMPRPGEPPLGAGESSSVPGTAAIANAIFDATGVRLRQPPFTPEVVRAALQAHAAAGTRAGATAQVGTNRDARLAAGPGARLSGGAAERETADIAHPSAPDSPGELGAPGAGRALAGAALAVRVPADPAIAAPAPAAASTSASTSASAAWRPRHRSLARRAVALLAGVVGVAAALLGWRPAIAPVALSAAGAGTYTEAVLARGRQLAAAGNCSGCHTLPGGPANAGGLPMETPFGTVHATNITPDAGTGIGRWSFSAFQRAMRDGIGRDGRHLYPAFPYTAFARTSDDDLLAIYAHLMAQPAVQHVPPSNTLRFPFSLRPLLAGWNALFHDAATFTAQPSRSAEWNRGAYLVEGLGHCGGCHTPRNALGAERRGAAYLAGAMVDGWEAPALTAASASPLRWTADALFDYLRHGHSAEHGSAGGPMAPVVRELGALPDADIRAMAVYLAGLQGEPANAARVGADGAAVAAATRVAGADPATATRAGDAAVERPKRSDDANTERLTGAPAPATAVAAPAARASAVATASAARARRDPALLPDVEGRLFEGACGACHHDGDGPTLLGTNTPLALSTKLHGARPDNLIRTILDGVQQPPSPQLGFMPPFRHALNDAQIAALAAWMRRRFAPDAPPWPASHDSVAALRRAGQAP